MNKLMLVGCGLRGKSWARVVKDNPDCMINAYVDIDQKAIDNIKKFNQDTNISGFTDFDKAVREADVDAAIIVTPPQFHYQQAVAVIKRGLPLLVEKPLTEDYASSQDIVNRAEERGLPLIIGMQFRYMPVIQAYKRLFETGGFGTPSFSQFSYIRTRNPMSYKGMVLNQYCNDMTHTFLLEQAIHHLDLIRYVYSSEIESVYGYEWNPEQWKTNPYKQDPNVSMHLKLTNGMYVNYLGTWISGNEGMNEGIDFRWRTDFEKGIIIQKELFGEDGIYTATQSAENLTQIDSGPIEPFYTDTVMLLEEFINCLKNKKPPTTSGKDHLKTLAVVLAAIESSVTDKKVNVNEFMKKISTIH